MLIIPTIFALMSYTTFVSSTFDPCGGRSILSGPCDRDGDCEGFGVVCRSGSCVCHPDYQQKTDPDSKDVFCVKLPDTINAPCSGSCKSPMFCQSNKCQCVRSIVDGNRCYAAAAIGDTCSKDADCRSPFSYCSGGKCACLQGTTTQGSTCVATAQCPTGAKPKGSCVRKSENLHFIHNMVSSGGKLDNCPSGSYCFAPEGSSAGQCCPETCPLNGSPDTKYSCEPTATSTRCPPATHYCHRSAGNSHSSTVCCRMPCREPTPVYVKGQCYRKAFLGSPCVVNEQCDGGYGMQCTGGICKCTSGFTQYSDGYTTGDNPPQTCVRDCGSRTAHAGECFGSASLGGSCSVNKQCPSGSACLRGSCFCDCRAGFVKSSGGCSKGQQTARPIINTGKGSGGTGGGLLGGGGTKGGGGGLVDIFKGILPANGAGGLGGLSI